VAVINTTVETSVLAYKGKFTRARDKGAIYQVAFGKQAKLSKEDVFRDDDGGSLLMCCTLGACTPSQRHGFTNQAPNKGGARGCIRPRNAPNA
jgi:hypothetical protein